MTPSRIAELSKLANDWTLGSGTIRNALEEALDDYEALAAERDRLRDLATRVASARDEDESTMERCECYYTMGQVRHECIYCAARRALAEGAGKT